MLAWKKVSKEVADGSLGTDYDRTDRAEIRTGNRGYRRQLPEDQQEPRCVRHDRDSGRREMIGHRKSYLSRNPANNALRMRPYGKALLYT